MSYEHICTSLLMHSSKISKTITAILVLQLTQRNLLHLDDSVSKHLSSSELLLPLPSHHYLKAHGADITIRMLLNHTSGVPNPLPLDWFFLADTETSSSLNEKRQEAFYNVLQQSPKLKFIPGSNHLYSNVGYWILEKIIESVTGKSYDDVFFEQVALPLGFCDTSSRDICAKLAFGIPSPYSSNSENEQRKGSILAKGHSPRFSLQTFIFYLLTPKTYWSALNSYTWSGFRRLIPHGMGYGGMYASVKGLLSILNDLTKGMDFVLSTDEATNDNTDKDYGVLLSLESKRAMFGLCNDTPLGWATGTICVGNEQQPYLTKPGGGLGYHGNIRIYPRLGIATVFLCNGTCVSAGRINKWSDCLDLPFLAEKKAQIQKDVDESS